jgi:hypothetical protein
MTNASVFPDPVTAWRSGKRQECQKWESDRRDGQWTDFYNDIFVLHEKGNCVCLYGRHLLEAHALDRLGAVGEKISMLVRGRG